MTLEKSLKELDKDAISRMVVELTGSVKHWEGRLTKSQAKKNKNDGLLEAKQTELETWRNLGENCAYCKQPISRAFKEGYIGTVENQIVGLQKLDTLYTDECAQDTLKKQELEAEQNPWREKLNRIDHQRESLETDIAGINERISKAAKWPGLSDKVKEWGKRVANLENLMGKINAYSQHQLYEYDKKISECEGKVEIANKLDGLLKKDGAVRKIAGEGMKAMDFDQVFLDGWGMGELKLEPTGNIMYAGRPVEQASTSEKYRLGIVLAEFLGRKMGMEFLILDGVDVLQSAKGPLLSAMPRWMKHFKSIILIATDGKPPVPIKENWIEYHWVEDGKVTTVEEKRTAMAS